MATTSFPQKDEIVIAAFLWDARRLARPQASALALLALAALAILAGSARADSVSLVSVRDNTLYESASGTVSNGAGDGMFVGRTNQLSNSRRRGLVRFDVAAAIPAGSTVQGVVLQLFCDLSASGGTSPTALHRVLADWGEGTSNAGFPGGTGAPATAGDATWTFRFFPSATWTTAGGDFSPTVSGALAATPVGPVALGSTPAMVADVQGWLDAPATNFGWLLSGDESIPSTAERFETREAGGPAVPTLLVTYTPPGTPAQPATWGRLKGAYRQ